VWCAPAFSDVHQIVCSVGLANHMALYAEYRCNLQLQKNKTVAYLPLAVLRFIGKFPLLYKDKIMILSICVREKFCLIAYNQIEI